MKKARCMNIIAACLAKFEVGFEHMSKGSNHLAFAMQAAQMLNHSNRAKLLANAINRERKKKMRKNSKSLMLSGMAMILFLTIVSFAFPMEALAKGKTVAVEGMNYDVNMSMEDNLKSLLGKKASIITISGKVFNGFVKEVGPHLIHLEKLENKDFFDAPGMQMNVKKHVTLEPGLF